MSESKRSTDAEDILSEFDSGDDPGITADDPARAERGHDEPPTDDPGITADDPTRAERGHDEPPTDDPGITADDPARAERGDDEPPADDPGITADDPTNTERGHDDSPADDPGITADDPPNAERGHDEPPTDDPGITADDPTNAERGHDEPPADDPRPRREDPLVHDFVLVGPKSIMAHVSETLIRLSVQDTVTLKARGKKITLAVDISQLILRRMNRGEFVIGGVRTSSKPFLTDGGKRLWVSQIEIDISRN